MHTAPSLPRTTWALRIYPSMAKKMVIAIEKKASEHAAALLAELTCDAEVLEHARDTYGNWIKGYLKKAQLADKDIV